MKELTAMQEFIQALTENGLIQINQTLIDGALRQEKQQVIDSWENGYGHGACVNVDKDKYHGGQYYNETFKND